MRMLVIDDDARTRAFVAEGLRQQGHTVDEAGDGETGLHMAMEGQYDALVVDRMMPGLPGLEAVQAMRAGGLKTPVLMLTALGSVDDRVAGLNAGADDYLVKPFSFIELLARLQALVRRGRQQEPTELQIGDLLVNLIARRAYRDTTRLDLTGREFALLALLAQRRGQILSKTVIAAQVWDINFDSQTNVVEVAIKRLRAKIDGPFRTKLLHTVRGMGYVLEAREGEDEDDAAPGGGASA